MRAPRVLVWIAAAAAAMLAVAAVAQEPSAVDSHGVQLPPSYAQKKPASIASENCDPSKWKLPVNAKYDTKGKIDPHKLNVHLIAHSHDDPGWLVGIDQYYMERVEYILDTVVKELLENPDRQFMFVEQSFFQRWWHQQSSETKAVVKQLVKEGRLDLSVNGGWCMHDEATPHYTAMVDQTAYGHRLLKEEFNVTPRIGWQIDPFGHSSTQGSLLSAGVGFDALYFARIDYQDYDLRKSKKDLEFIWRPSKSRGKNSQVFTGEIIDHYGPPREFNYGYRDCQIQDDPELHDFNVCSTVDDFVKMSLDRGASTKGNHIFIPMGDDFQFDNARMWYKNMDKLVHYVNQDNRINVLYSNLSYYTDLKLAEDLTWSVKTDDFFPYSSGKHQYWSGFFTSRPGLKRFARVSNTLLQQVRQLNALYQSHHSAQLDKLQRAVGLVQHHDGLSGTEKQSVADDYALRLNDGVLEAEKEFNEVFFVIGEKEKYKFCLLANTSTCDVSTSNEKFEALVHNALARKSVQTISIPIKYKDVDIQVISGTAKVRQQEVFAAVPVHPEQKAAPFSLVFSTELDPMSEARFMISKKASSSDGARKPSTISSALGDKSQVVVTLENDLVRVKIAKHTGSIISITNKKKNIELPLNSSVLYYQAFQADNEQRSGAYIFRPDSKTVYHAGKGAEEVRLVDLQVNAASGSVSRVAFHIGGWVTLEYRVNDGDEFVEIEWTVGSISIEDKKGKEVIIRFDSQNSIKSAKTLYTDSNGLEFVTRVRNHRDTWNLTLHDDQEFVAANYFPITTGAYIKDDKYQLNVVTDRAQGAASLEDGQIEVMVHRRLLADDGKGVGEHLNETESFFNKAMQKEKVRGLIVRGNFFINVDSAREGIRSIRTKMEKQFFAPLVAFRKPVPADAEVEGKVPWLKVDEFPENVGLTTLQELSKDCIMARLSHLYSIEEHESLSKSVKVDFSKLLTVKNTAISEVTELLLTGIASLSSQEREPHGMKWKTNEFETYEMESKPALPVKGTEVELQAMEVRSFRVCFKKSSAEKQVAVVAAAAEDETAVDYDDMNDYLRSVKEQAFLKLAESEPDLTQLEEIMALQ